ncbi:MAG: 50S ribosomal protein L29 [Candidatus Pacebacteria bacterium]|jgi:large subunit ribosomal protein L29|nr:50S ribosomal protein L29 [Candidatus Paceibacterota bacterium]
MKSNDIKALHDKDQIELKKELSVLMKDLAGMRLLAKAGKLDSPAKLKNLRKDVARIKTVLREKELKQSI